MTVGRNFGSISGHGLFVTAQNMCPKSLKGPQDRAGAILKLMSHKTFECLLSQLTTSTPQVPFYFLMNCLYFYNHPCITAWFTVLGHKE